MLQTAKMMTLERGLHDVRRASMRAAGSGQPPQDVPPGAQPAWSRATSYERRKVVFMGAGRTRFCGPLLASRENPQRRSNTMELRTRTERSCSRPTWAAIMTTNPFVDGVSDCDRQVPATGTEGTHVKEHT